MAFVRGLSLQCPATKDLPAQETCKDPRVTTGKLLHPVSKVAVVVAAHASFSEKAPQPLAPTKPCADAEQKIVHVIIVFELILLI